MNTFTYHSKYGTIYENCYFVVNKYVVGDSLAIQIFNDTEGPIANVTVNTGEILEDNQIAIKDYSEGAGILDEMERIGLVTSVDRYIESGFVDIPICTYNEEVLKYYSR